MCDVERQIEHLPPILVIECVGPGCAHVRVLRLLGLGRVQELSDSKAPPVFSGAKYRAELVSKITYHPDRQHFSTVAVCKGECQRYDAMVGWTAAVGRAKLAGAFQHENFAVFAVKKSIYGYCLCDTECAGVPMDECSNGPLCGLQWFHLKCVGLDKEPSGRTKWTCPLCAEAE